MQFFSTFGLILFWWRPVDSNPRPPACEAGTTLLFSSITGVLTSFLHLIIKEIVKFCGCFRSATLLYVGVNIARNNDT